RQRQQRRVEWQDRPVRREDVGGGAGGRRNHDAVADQFVQPDIAVDGDAYLRSLSRLAEQRHLVDGDGRDLLAVIGDGVHLERADRLGRGGGNAFGQAVLAIVVHQ